MYLGGCGYLSTFGKRRVWLSSYLGGIVTYLVLFLVFLFLFYHSCFLFFPVVDFHLHDYIVCIFFGYPCFFLFFLVVGCFTASLVS